MFRPPQIDLASVLKQSDPKLDLQIPAYEQSSRNFLTTIVKYKNGAMSAITDMRRKDAAEIKRLADDFHAAEAATNQCKLDEIKLLADLEQERKDLKEAETSLTAFNLQLSTLNERKQNVDTDIEHYRAISANLRRERDKERATLEKFSSRILPELQLHERRLACVVEGIEKDKLLIRFTHIDPLNVDREFSFVVDASTRVYKVLTTTPPLPTLPLLVDELNASRDVYFFIAKMRKAYALLVQQGG